MTMNQNYSYPLQPEWSTADIVAVTRLYADVETAYEEPHGIAAAKLLADYQAFQTVVPQKFEEKQLDKAFQTASGYSIYQTVKRARTVSGQIKMK